MTTFENLVNSLTLDNVQCIICGSEHDYTDCTFIRIQCYVIDNTIPTKARLTMPGFLQVQVLADGTNSVITNETIMSGTCFGPVEGVKSSTLHPKTQFPLKVFNTGPDNCEEYYLECLDENKCNWMMFVAAADDREEQNLTCFQEGDNIYYVSMREIQAGESLKVWYGPYYANKMNVDLLNVVREERDNVDVNALVKRQQKIMERKSWICKYCGKVETFVTDFAKHMIEHYRNKRKCGFCNENFRTAQAVKQHIKICHPNELTDAQEKLLKHKEGTSENKTAKNMGLGGPLLNEMLNLSDSLDNTSMDFHQTVLNNLTTDDILLETENTNLNVDNLINDNVKQLDHFNFEIGESQDQLICDICLKEFDKVNSLVEHLRQHTGEFLCHQCLKVFPRKENLTNHLCNLTSTFDCTICKKPFSQKKYLRRHMVVVHENTFQCDKCKKSFSSQNELSKHNCQSVPPSEQQTFSCTKCSKVFNKNKSLNQHMKTHLSESAKNESNTAAICDDCGEIFTTRKSYYSHILLHKECKFKCDVCDKKFHKSNNLKEHMKIHSEEKPVTCDVCNKELKNNRILQIHKRQHLPADKVKCPSCDQTFTSAEGRRRHLKRRHNENKEEVNNDMKMFKCTLCNARTKFKSSIVRHIKQKHPDAKADIDYTLIEKMKFKNVLNEIRVMKSCHNGDGDNPQSEENPDRTSTLVPELPNVAEEMQSMSVANDEISYEVMTKVDNLNSINEDEPVKVTSNQNGIGEFNVGKNITNHGLDDCDLEFETILNEPNQENYERYFSFDDIDSNDTEHNYTGFSGNENEQGSNANNTTATAVDNGPFILENGPAASNQQTDNPNNIVVYIIKQNDETLA